MTFKKRVYKDDGMVEIKLDTAKTNCAKRIGAKAPRKLLNSENEPASLFGRYRFSLKPNSFATKLYACAHDVHDRGRFTFDQIHLCLSCGFSYRKLERKAIV